MALPSTDPADRPGRSAGPVPRPAATLLLVRDAPPALAADSDPAPVAASLEVLMVRRSERADFVGGAHVFPGGGLDHHDNDAASTPGVPSVVTGRSDREASALLGLAQGGLAYWVAAVRECFEEAGVLLAYRTQEDGGPLSLLSLSSRAERSRFDGLRRRLNAGELQFVAMCRQQGLTLALDRVHYFAHWITPEGATKRYDTRFFVAAMPEEQTARRDEREIVDEVWLRPADALDLHREGRIDLVLPTVRCLHAIGRFTSAIELLRAVRTDGGVASMVADSHGRRIRLPGDPPGNGPRDAPGNGRDGRAGGSSGRTQ